METPRLEDRLTSIETRLSKIESRFGTSTEAPPAKKESNPWIHDSSPRSPRQESASLNLPEATQGNWLGIIAVICFVLAAGFIIKLSIDSGWLTPIRQIGLASLLGMSLVGAGFALMQSDREYASFLPSAGVIVLYLTAFAAHRLYSLISFEMAIGMTGFVSGLCIWLYTEIRHDVYPITASIGAYVAPAVLGFNAYAEFSLYYFLICTVAFATISIWVRSRTLTVISAYLALAVTSWIGLGLHKDIFIAGMLALHFVVFSTGTYLHTRQTNVPLSETESWSLFPVLLIFYAMEYYLINRIYPGLAPWASLGFAGVLIGLYVSAKKYFPDGLSSQSLILAFASIVCFHSVYLELLPDTLRPWLFVAIMLGVAFFPFKLAEGKIKLGSPVYVPMLALLAVLAIEYLTMLSHLLKEDNSSWLVVSFAALASIWLVLVRGADSLVKRNTYGHMLLGTAHLLAILGLYRLTNDVGSLAVSASWLFYAVGVIVFAFTRKDEDMAKSALFVLGFAAAKALLYDAASAPTAVRIFCLLLTGAVLYGCGFFMRQIANWKDSSAP